MLKPRTLKGNYLVVVLACLSLAGAGLTEAKQQHPPSGSTPAFQAYLTKEVRHQLVTLPFYTLFDNLQFQAQGGKVILLGEVTNPTLKKDAEAAVKSIEGVESVENRIEVLPPSPMDDQ